MNVIHGTQSRLPLSDNETYINARVFLTKSRASLIDNDISFVNGWVKGAFVLSKRTQICDIPSHFCSFTFQYTDFHYCLGFSLIRLINPTMFPWLFDRDKHICTCVYICTIYSENRSVVLFVYRFFHQFQFQFCFNRDV